MIGRIVKLSLISVITFALSFSSVILYKSYTAELVGNAKIAHIQEIYKKLVQHTGMGNEMPGLIIVQNPTFNAYSAVGRIVFFTGLLDSLENDDQIAWILAHELAHQTLRHVFIINKKLADLDIVHIEANADKMGGFYMMAAGYDICKGREAIRIMKNNTSGDYLGGNHPGYAYRFNELNINCGNAI